MKYKQCQPFLPVIMHHDVFIAIRRRKVWATMLEETRKHIAAKQPRNINY